MRVLFLDFDGVFHPSRLAIADPGQPIADLVQSNDLFRWTPLLDKLLTGHPDVALVVHSSWRFLAEDETLRDLLGPLGTRFKGSAPPGQRYEAIKWLLDDNLHITDYRILDDDQTEFPLGLPELILCDSDLGLTDIRVQDAITAWLAEGAARLEGEARWSGSKNRPD